MYLFNQCQNERIWQLIGILKDYLKKQEMVGLLEDNHQFVPIGEQNVLNSLSDSILFGKFHFICIMSNLIFIFITLLHLLQTVFNELELIGTHH